MDTTAIKGSVKEFKEKIKKQWNKLTDAELDGDDHHEFDIVEDSYRKIVAPDEEQRSNREL